MLMKNKSFDTRRNWDERKKNRILNRVIINFISFLIVTVTFFLVGIALFELRF